MKEQDQILAQVIQQLSVDRGRTGDVDDSRTRDRIEFLGPQLSLEELKQAITTRLVDQIGSTWDERYGELLAFKETHGHCGVPVSFVTPNGHALGRWVGKQRKKRGSLSPERMTRLNGIGFVWDMNTEFLGELGFIEPAGE